MRPLNYCRQAIKQLLDRGDDEEDCRRLIGASVAAHKFILPPGGILLDDPSLRAIDESEELRLPFSCIALEFPDAERAGRGAIVFAQDEGERIRGFICFKANDCWMTAGSDFSVPKRGYMDRSVSGYMDYPGLIMFDRFEGTEKQLDPKDNYIWLRVLLSFVNVLSCSNVAVDRVEPRKGARSKKAALPFDAYHVLTVRPLAGKAAGGGANCGGHRAPREHLRRGHIRRYETGLRVWVNATVVNPGIGGRVSKEYALSS